MVWIFVLSVVGRVGRYSVVKYNVELCGYMWIVFLYWGFCEGMKLWILWLCEGMKLWIVWLYVDLCHLSRVLRMYGVINFAVFHFFNVRFRLPVCFLWRKKSIMESYMWDGGYFINFSLLFSMIGFWRRDLNFMVILLELKLVLCSGMWIISYRLVM